ncbi:hypothetical protein GCM10009759_50040 [Kitasatospora saccharophila]|uniref:Uncharacterized protein n=1 Tax=Kitasatospora saccharophila TaxID=407973 RepID=A0ABN2XE94_9ACTN
MTAVCPSCSLADRTVPVPAALRDRDVPLDKPDRGLLDVPPEPVGRSGVSTGLLLLAAFSSLWTVRAVLTLVRSGSAATAGQVVATVVVATVMAGSYWASSALRRAADRRQAAKGGWPASSEQWKLVHRVWQAAWLCRNCRAAFLPAGALGPGFPASGPLSFEHFRDWLTGTARQAEQLGGFAPADRKPAAPAAPAA